MGMFRTPTKRADAGLQEGPAAKRFCKALRSPSKSPVKVCKALLQGEEGPAAHGPHVEVALRRPSKPTQKPWPVSKLNAFAMPTEGFGWGKLLDRCLESRGWKILRPCTVVADKRDFTNKDEPNEPDDITLFPEEFEGLLRGENFVGEVEPGQVTLGKRPDRLPSHAMMLMNSVLSRDDFAKMFLTHKKSFSKPGTKYTFGAIPGSDTALFKCNFSKAFRNDDFYPKAYVLPQEEDLLRKDMKASVKSYWIAKPNDDFGGSGITVWSHDDAGFLKLIDDARKQPRSIVQKYVHNPMLLGPFKFHMRIHLVIASFSPLKAYVHEGGQVLCGTRPFTLSKKTLNATFDRAVHLTNQCFNAKIANKDNYLRNKPVIGEGQQITIPELEEYLKKHHAGFDKKDMWRQIVHIGKKMAEYIESSRTVRPHISKLDSGEVFEVFGMDLMLDSSCKVLMCETNNSPGLCYPDRTILGAPNPDYQKEVTMCKHVHHDTMALLGLDAGKKQTRGSLAHWYEIDFEQK